MSVVSRFAPSPTGRLHLGHSWSAVQAHDRARQEGGRFLLRIEDIDGTRSRPEHVDAILRDLEWLGLEWDGPVVFQSQRLDTYQQALDRLRGMGLLYPCTCTRADIAASLSAPHGAEGVYPGTCRGRVRDLSLPHSWRLDMAAAAALLPLPSGEGRGPSRRDGKNEGRKRHGPALTLPPPMAAPSLSQGEREIWWHDELAGDVLADPLAHGDVILARKDAPASYHLAVTVDDAAQGVTHVVRGRDLFAATHVHRLLQALLGLAVPVWRHHPLLVGADGNRLAKRHGAPALETMRLAGVDGRALADALRRGELPVGIAVAKD